MFLEDVVAPAEVPVEVNAWKTQQFRWAKGSVQTARKLLPRLVESGLPWRVKSEASIHLTANFSYLLMALVALLVFPAIVSRQGMGWYRVLVVDLPLFVATTAVISRFYICSQKEIYADWKTRLTPWTEWHMNKGDEPVLLIAEVDTGKLKKFGEL